MLNSGNLDVDYLGNVLGYALLTLRKLSAPARDDELKRKHQEFMNDLSGMCYAQDSSSENSQVAALIKGIRFVLEQIQVLIVSEYMNI